MTHRGYLKAHMAKIKPEVYGDLECNQHEVSIKYDNFRSVTQIKCEKNKTLQRQCFWVVQSIGRHCLLGP